MILDFLCLYIHILQTYTGLFRFNSYICYSWWENHSDVAWSIY